MPFETSYHTLYGNFLRDSFGAGLRERGGGIVAYV